MIALRRQPITRRKREQSLKSPRQGHISHEGLNTKSSPYPQAAVVAKIEQCPKRLQIDKSMATRTEHPADQKLDASSPTGTITTLIQKKRRAGLRIRTTATPRGSCSLREGRRAQLVDGPMTLAPTPPNAKEEADHWRAP
jgi:hypothetical protein